MKKLLLVVTFILNYIVAHSQQTFYVNGDVFLPGIQLEYNFNEKHALVMNNYYFPAIGYIGSDWYYDHIIRSNLQYRYYYNKSKRSARGLNIQNNSSNYFLAQMEHALLLPRPQFNLRILFTAGWGFKRFIGKSNWYYGAELGVSTVMISDENRLLFGPYYHFKLGYMLYKKPLNTLKK